jgi:hypothetical protein
MLRTLMRGDSVCLGVLICLLKWMTDGKGPSFETGGIGEEPPSRADAETSESYSGDRSGQR